MDIADYAISLRKELIYVVSGIKNASSYAGWDSTTPNYLIKSRLQEIYNIYMLRAFDFGVCLAERHSSCQHPAHSDYYVSILINGGNKRIPYLSDDYIWNGNQIDQGEKLCVCPCSPGSPPKKHYVIEDVIFSKSADYNTGEAIYRILLDIHSAMDQSDDKRPRSGVREYILRAILRLNDLILQEPIEEKIAKILENRLAVGNGQPEG